MTRLVINPLDETQQARLISGLLVATFPGKSYKCELLKVSVNCSKIATVNIYRGAIAEPSRFSRNPLGDVNSATFLYAEAIPPGFNLFVVWETATGTASATIKTRGVL